MGPYDFLVIGGGEDPGLLRRERGERGEWGERAGGESRDGDECRRNDSGCAHGFPS